MDTDIQLKVLLDGSEVAIYQLDSLGKMPTSPVDWRYKGRAAIVSLSQKRLQELGISVALTILQFEPKYVHILFGKLLVDHYSSERTFCLDERVQEHWVELRCPDIEVTFNFDALELESEEMITRNSTDYPRYVIDHIPYT